MEDRPISEEAHPPPDAEADKALRRILGLVEQEYGVACSPGRIRRMEAAVERRCWERGFGSPVDYLRFLFSDARAGREILHLARETANHETYFFREPTHLELLKTRLELLHREGGMRAQRIRLISAGSSTGEEAYSIAAAVLETGLLASGKLQIEVQGIDLDPVSIEQAREGTYTGHSLRGVAPERIRMWFRKVGRDRYQVSDDLRRLVRFSCANILEDPAVGDLGSAQVIFCRNVLIYMTSQAVDRLAERLHARLHSGGWLIIGHSETLLHRRDLFEPARSGEAVAYVKR